jgi:hypothetical protein
MSSDDYDRPLDFDLYNQRGPGAETPQTVFDDRRRQQQVLFLSLLCQSGVGGPVTEVSPPVNGDWMNNGYQELFRNTTNNLIRVQAFAEFTTPGCGAILSLTPDLSDVGKYDVLSLTANGRTESVTTILLPGFSIYARDFNTAIPMQGVDQLRIRAFDPMKLISFSNLYPQGA